MSHKPINAHIMGQSYVLSAPSHEVADLRAAVGRVDEAMCRIRDAGKIKARERIAVLAALNIAFDAEQAHTTPTAQPGTRASAANLPAINPPAHASAQAEPSELPAELQGNDQRLAALIYKLDQALGRDGHLL